MPPTTLSVRDPKNEERQNRKIDWRGLEPCEEHLIPVEWNTIYDDLVGPAEKPPASLFAFEAERRERDYRKVADREPLCSQLDVSFLVGGREVVTAEEEI